jgi:hypothetical protein
MAFTHPHINAYVIVGGDSDFISLVEKLKQYDKKVLVVGGRSFTSQVLQRNCHEFIAYENLTGVNGRRPQDRGGRPAGREATQAPLEQIFPLVRRALKVLADREVSPQLGLLKSTLLQLDSTFSERSYGAGTFRDFAERLEKAGLVTLKIAGRNILVELKDDERAARMPVVVDSNPETLEGAEGGESPESPQAFASPVLADPARQAEGIDVVRRLLSESQTLRFPMYVRNVKQVLRQANGSFDERAYGFAGLMDLLRACQREGVLRMERDRRGALRVFPGAQVPTPAREATSPSSVIEGEVEEPGSLPDQLVPGLPESAGFPELAAFGGTDEEESSAHITDTTAEMLARAAAGDASARRRKPAGGTARGRRTGARTQSGRQGRSRPRRGSTE